MTSVQNKALLLKVLRAAVSGVFVYTCSSRPFLYEGDLIEFLIYPK